MQKTIHSIVKGKVQGVWYRASTQQEATSLGLTGWVRNLADGSVELTASGDETQVEKLKNWLWQGPSNASVDQVNTTSQPYTKFDGFQIL